MVPGLFVLRFFAHFAFFKIASALMIVEPLNISGAFMTALVYSFFAFFFSGWLTQRQFDLLRPYRRIFAPLFATFFLFVIMSFIGPLIALGFSPNSVMYHGEVDDWLASALGGRDPWLPRYLSMIGVICLGFLAYAIATRRDMRKVFSP